MSQTTLAAPRGASDPTSRRPPPRSTCPILASSPTRGAAWQGNRDPGHGRGLAEARYPLGEGEHLGSWASLLNSLINRPGQPARFHATETFCLATNSFAQNFRLPLCLQTKVAEWQRWRSARGSGPQGETGRTGPCCLFLGSQKPSLLGPVFVNDQLFP